MIFWLNAILSVFLTLLSGWVTCLLFCTWSNVPMQLKYWKSWLLTFLGGWVCLIFTAFMIMIVPCLFEIAQNNSV